jgi:AraC-like DNA-binding protein
MTKPHSDDSNLPVTQTELITQDMDLLSELSRQVYVEHTARFRCADPHLVDGRMNWAVTESVAAGLVRYAGFVCQAEMEPVDMPNAAVLKQGVGEISHADEELRYGPGCAFLLPADRPSATLVGAVAMATLQVPLTVAGALAEEWTGMPAADLRFAAMAPVSAARQGTFGRTVDFICDQLVTSAITEIEPLLAQELTRLAAVAMLETFPNTTMTAGYLPGPGWVASATVDRATEFIDARAGRPITIEEVAAWADVTVFALRYSFQQHFGTTPEGYLRRIRLERAHQDLSNADPTSGITAAGVARRWGWASLSQFNIAYLRRFGKLPSRAPQN